VEQRTKEKEVSPPFANGDETSGEWKDGGKTYEEPPLNGGTQEVARLRAALDRVVKAAKGAGGHDLSKEEMAQTIDDALKGT
jgi:hypothetical protein